VDRIDAEDATGGSHDHLEGRTVAGWLTPEIDAQLEAAQLEFEREQGLSPELETVVRLGCSSVKCQQRDRGSRVRGGRGSQSSSAVL